MSLVCREDLGSGFRIKGTSLRDSAPYDFRLPQNLKLQVSLHDAEPLHRHNGHVKNPTQSSHIAPASNPKASTLNPKP